MFHNCYGIVSIVDVTYHFYPTAMAGYCQVAKKSLGSKKM